MNVKKMIFNGKSADSISTTGIMTSPTTMTNISVSRVKSAPVYCEAKNSHSTDQLKVMDWIKVNRIQLTTLLIALVSFICFIPSISNDFVFDDIPTIINNKDIRPEKSLIRIFFNDFWGTPINKEESHKSYRPLTILTFRWNYMLHGLQVTGYHLVNSILHSIVSALFFRLCICFNLQFWESVIASIYFAIHPIHVDAVASIVGRAELLSALFSLSALLYWCHNNNHNDNYHHHHHHHHHHPDNDYTNDNNSDKSILIVFVLTLIGTFCKEQASTTLIVCIFHESLFKYNLRSKILQNTDRWVNWVKSNFNLRNITNSNGKQSNCKLSSSSSSMVPQSKSSCAFYANIFYFSMGFMTISCLRFAIMNNKLPSFNRLDNPARILTSPYRQLNYAFIWSYNCWLLLYPVNLSCDWSSTSIQLIVSLIDPKNILTLLLFISLTVILLKGDTITWMAMGFMVITFLPVSNIFFPVGFVIAERVLYLPSMGFSMILARGFILLYSSIIIKSKRWIQLTFYLLTIVFLSSLTIKTIHRCSEWKNELSLFTSGLNVNPGNVKLLNNVGRLYEDQGNLALALSYYEKSVTIEPDDVRGYLNLGKALTKIGRLPEAEMFYRKALDLIPKSSRSTSPLKNPNDISENIDPLPVDKLSANSYLASLSSRSSLSLSLSSLLTSSSAPLLPTPSSSVSSLIADKPIEQQNTDQSKIIGRLSFPVYERLVNQGTNTDHNDYTLIDYNDAVNGHHQDDNLKESKTTTTTITTDNNLSSSITLNHLQGLLNYASLISRDESRLDEANRMFLTIASLRPDYSATYSTWIQSMINAGSVNNNKNHNDNDNDATTINGNQFNDETILSQFTLNNKQTDPNILYNMAILFNNNGNLENALNLFDQILKIDPYHQETLSTSARIIKDNELIGDYLTIAIERLETLVSMGKADETVYFDLGMLSIRSGSMATARKHFAKAIELKPNFTEALFNMALLLYKEDQPQDALPFLKFILKTERTHGKALLLMLAINSSTNEVDDQSGSLKVQQLPSSSSPESKEFFGAQSNSNTFYT